MKSIISLLVSLVSFITVDALTVEEARHRISSGYLDNLLNSLDSLSVANPKSAAVDMARGEYFVATAQDAHAIDAFGAAHRKGSNDALLSLAEIAARQYRVDDAEDYVDQYKSFIVKNKKKKLVDESEDVAAVIRRTSSMLDRVEKITVIDSIAVDRDEFFRAFKLSPESGTLNSPDILPNKPGENIPTVVYLTEDGREMLWAESDSSGVYLLKMSNRLSDGTWEEPEPVGDHLGEGGDANYPFLMPDGVTLYFASDNEDSLGGYDIFISRNNGEEFLQPQNIGMPYNSPYDDYMLAIDEMTGVGWWATDRNRLGDKITIYTFIPSDMRVNVDIDSPDLVSRARLTSYRDTWEPGKDYKSLLDKITDIRPQKTDEGESFIFPLPDGRVVTSLDGFRNFRASQTMARYLKMKEDIDNAKDRLSGLRSKYASGDRSVSDKILELEGSIARAEKELKRLSDDVVRAETR